MVHWHPQNDAHASAFQSWQLGDTKQSAQVPQSRLVELHKAFTRETEQLHAIIAALEHSAKTREFELQTLQNQFHQLGSVLQHTTNELSIQQQRHFAELEELRDFQDNEHSHLAGLQADKSRLASELEAVHSELEKAKKANRKLAIDFANAANKSPAADSQTLTAKNAEIQRLSRMIDAVETQHTADKEEFRDRIAEYQANLQFQQESAATLRDELQTQSMAFTKFKQERSVAENRALRAARIHNAETEKLNKEIENAKERLASLQQQLNQRDRDNTDLQVANTGLAETVESLKIQQEDYEKTVAAANTELATQKQRNLELHATLTEREHISDTFSSEANALKVELSLVQAEQQNLVAEIQTLQATHQTSTSVLESRLQDSEASNTQHTTTIADLQDSLAVAELQLAERDDKHTKLQQRLESGESDNETYVAELNDQFNAQYDSLKQTHKDEVEGLVRLASKHGSDLLAAQEQLEAANTKIASLELQLESVNAQIEQATLAANKSDQETTQRISELNAVLADQQHKATEFANQNTALQNNVDRLQLELQASQEHAATVLGNQKTMSESHAKELQATVGLNARLAAQKDKLTKQLAENEANLETKNAEIATLQLEHQALQVQLDEKNLTSVPRSRVQHYRQAVNNLRSVFLEQRDSKAQADLSIAQLNQTIVHMEHNADGLKTQIQREAAARRKAESALRRIAKSGLQEDDRETITTIRLDAKVERLTRELASSRRARMIERQQNAAELKRVLESNKDSGAPQE